MYDEIVLFGVYCVCLQELSCFCVAERWADAVYVAFATIGMVSYYHWHRWYRWRAARWWQQWCANHTPSGPPTKKCAHPSEFPRASALHRFYIDGSAWGYK